MGKSPFVTLGAFTTKKNALTVRTSKTGSNVNLFLGDTSQSRLFPLNLRQSLPPGRPHEPSDALSVTELRDMRKWSPLCQENRQSLLIMEEGELEKRL